MNDKLLVSVILPVFNCEDYIAKAIQSILDQTHTNFELFILNDASTDNSEAVISKFDDPRIRYISFEKNSKKIGIVNHALGLVKGDLIAFQDADDWSDKRRLEKQVRQFADPELIICFTGCKIHSVNNKEGYRITDTLLRQEFHELDLWNYGKYRQTVCATMMFRSNVLTKEPGYNEWFVGKVGEDIHWVYRILKHGKGCTIPEELYYYNYNRPGSFTHQQELEFKPTLLYSLKLLSKIIEQDIKHNIDVLNIYNKEELLKLELEACQDVLSETYKKNVDLKKAYDTSLSYKVGKTILFPFRLLKNRTAWKKRNMIF